MNKKLLVVIGIFVLIFAGYFGFSFYAANTMVKIQKGYVSADPEIIASENEVISFKTPDNITLHGWFFPIQSDNAIILTSGLLENRENLNYYGPLLEKDLLAEGYSVLVYDSRNFNTSNNKYVRYGTQEDQDIVGAVRFLESKGFLRENIGIIGYSTGAVSTIMAIDDIQGIGAIVADTSAADYKQIVEYVLVNERGVPSIFLPGIFYVLSAIYDVDISKVKPIDEVAKSSVPILFLHGEKDTSIPLEHSKRLLEIAPAGSRLVIFDEASHIESFKRDPEKYRLEVMSYLNQRLKD